MDSIEASARVWSVGESWPLAKSLIDARQEGSVWHNRSELHQLDQGHQRRAAIGETMMSGPRAQGRRLGSDACDIRRGPEATEPSALAGINHRRREWTSAALPPRY